VSYRSFDVAQQQYLLAQNTAMRQLRAYVLVKEATFVEPPEVGRPWEVNLTLENYGQTPAYDATVRLSRELEPAKPSDAVLTLGADVKPLGQLPIPPRNPQIIRNTCAEWHSELIRWNDIARNKREAYIWGRVDYSDIDGNPCFTRFQMVNRFGATLSFSFCEKGNETDRRPARIDRAERDDIKTS
jgi:hypothetical protein